MNDDSKLPTGWRWVRFGDVVRQVKATTKDPESDGLTRVVGLEHLDSESLRVRRWNDLADLGDGTSFTRVFRSGQVLFGKRRAYQRKVAVPDFDGMCSGDILVFEPLTEDLLPTFLPYLVQSDGFFDHALGTSAGSLSPRTKWQELVKYEFALPPAPEQARIAEVVACTDQIEADYQNADRSSTLLALAEAGVFLDGTRETVMLGDVASVVGGVTKDSNRLASPSARSVPYLRVANVLRGSINIDDVASITVEPRVIEKLRLEPGDVLLNEGGDRDKLGRGWIWKGEIEDCIHQNHVFRARLNDDRVSPHLVAWMANFGNPRWFEANGRQTTNLASISLTKVREFPLPILGAAERDRFEAVVKSDVELRQRIRAAQHALRHTRHALIEDLLSGSSR